MDLRTRGPGPCGPGGPSGPVDLPRDAWRRIPLGTVGFFSEVRRDDERKSEVLGVGDDGHHHQVIVAVGLAEALEVLGHVGPGAVGDAVLAQVARLQVRRDDLERSRARALAWSEPERYRHADRGGARLP